MRARYTTFNSSLTFEIEGDGPKAIIKELAAIQEVFEAERVCGVCAGEEIRFQFRQVDDFDFYELLCCNSACRARFAFGQAKKGGGLFPKRKDEDGNRMENGGWSKYVRPGEEPAKAPEPRSMGRPTSSLIHDDAERARPPQERQIPVEMLAYYERIEKNRGLFVNACQAMESRMKERDPRRGGQIYDRIVQSVEKRWPKGIREMVDVKTVLIELWDAFEALADDPLHV